jgi:hypothetical protein
MLITAVRSSQIIHLSAHAYLSEEPAVFLLDVPPVFELEVANDFLHFLRGSRTRRTIHDPVTTSGVKLRP